MKEQKKKRVIVLLLLISCMVSGFMLFNISDRPPAKLQSFAQADSLIAYELRSFSISDQQISRSSMEVDSTFSRKIYHIDLPAGFSKTQLHAELNRRFHALGVSTPARVSFSDQQMRIHLEYKGTVFRTVALHTDPDLVYHRDRASIIVAIERFPDDELLNTLTTFGEPIPIVLSINHPMEANELQKSLAGQYDRILFWLRNDENEDLMQHNPSVALRRLKQFENVLPNAKLLLSGSDNSPDAKNMAARTDLTFVDAREALYLHEYLGKASFLEELNKLKSGQSYSLAIITGNETTLHWLGEKLPELKKAGVELIPPPKINF
ncbi:hypothetical protein SAMN05443144_104125 [Fodinibius roseus]|uniref:Divergent polysaccharide deacetylase n=2 Tax=Fodinibius roseus TaxID=1194090 RepID=A0A1M4XH05_9BACT|nr:hypothetical protein SAMN05443144_104125 [Fodinibius roseus]